CHGSAIGVESAVEGEEEIVRGMDIDAIAGQRARQDLDSNGRTHRVLAGRHECIERGESEGSLVRNLDSQARLQEEVGEPKAGNGCFLDARSGDVQLSDGILQFAVNRMVHKLELAGALGCAAALRRIGRWTTGGGGLV